MMPFESAAPRVAKRIRGGSGLGDALYVRPIAEHFVRAGDRVVVCTNYPDVFIGSGAAVDAFSRQKIDVLAHYASRKADTTTNQWEDVCISARVPPMPLRFAWTVQNARLVEEVTTRAAGRPIVLVHAGYVPMGRTDGFGAELLPEREAVETTLQALQDVLLVRIGKDPVYPLRCELDLQGRTSITDLLDLASICHGAVGQCSYIIPLAEAAGKPLLIVWASRGLTAHQPFVRAITPKKVLSAPGSRFAFDNQSAEAIRDAARELRSALT